MWTQTFRCLEIPPAPCWAPVALQFGVSAHPASSRHDLEVIIWILLIPLSFRVGDSHAIFLSFQEHLKEGFVERNGLEDASIGTHVPNSPLPQASTAGPEDVAVGREWDGAREWSLLSLMGTPSCLPRPGSRYLSPHPQLLILFGSRALLPTLTTEWKGVWLSLQPLLTIGTGHD